MDASVSTTLLALGAGTLGEFSLESGKDRLDQDMLKVLTPLAEMEDNMTDLEIGLLHDLRDLHDTIKDKKSVAELRLLARQFRDIFQDLMGRIHQRMAWQKIFVPETIDLGENDVLLSATLSVNYEYSTDLPDVHFPTGTQVFFREGKPVSFTLSNDLIVSGQTFAANATITTSDIKQAQRAAVERARTERLTASLEKVLEAIVLETDKWKMGGAKAKLVEEQSTIFGVLRDNVLQLAEEIKHPELLQSIIVKKLLTGKITRAAWASADPTAIVAFVKEEMAKVMPAVVEVQPEPETPKLVIPDALIDWVVGDSTEAGARERVAAALAAPLQDDPAAAERLTMLTTVTLPAFDLPGFNVEHPEYRQAIALDLIGLSTSTCSQELVLAYRYYLSEVKTEILKLPFDSDRQSIVGTDLLTGSLPALLPNILDLFTPENKEYLAAAIYRLTTEPAIAKAKADFVQNIGQPAAAARLAGYLRTGVKRVKARFAAVQTALSSSLNATQTAPGTCAVSWNKKIAPDVDLIITSGSQVLSVRPPETATGTFSLENLLAGTHEISVRFLFPGYDKVVATTTCIIATEEAAPAQEAPAAIEGPQVPDQLVSWAAGATAQPDVKAGVAAALAASLATAENPAAAVTALEALLSAFDLGSLTIESPVLRQAIAIDLINYAVAYPGSDKLPELAQAYRHYLEIRIVSDNPDFQRVFGLKNSTGAFVTLIPEILDLFTPENKDYLAAAMHRVMSFPRVKAEFVARCGNNTAAVKLGGFLRTAVTKIKEKLAADHKMLDRSLEIIGPSATACTLQWDKKITGLTAASVSYRVQGSGEETTQIVTLQPNIEGEEVTTEGIGFLSGLAPETIYELTLHLDGPGYRLEKQITCTTTAAPLPHPASDASDGEWLAWLMQLPAKEDKMVNLSEVFSPTVFSVDDRKKALSVLFKLKPANAVLIVTGTRDGEGAGAYTEGTYTAAAEAHPEQKVFWLHMGSDLSGTDDTNLADRTYGEMLTIFLGLSEMKWPLIIGFPDGKATEMVIEGTEFRAAAPAKAEVPAPTGPLAAALAFTPNSETGLIDLTEKVRSGELQREGALLMLQALHDEAPANTVIILTATGCSACQHKITDKVFESYAKSHPELKVYWYEMEAQHELVMWNFTHRSEETAYPDLGGDGSFPIIYQTTETGKPVRGYIIGDDHHFASIEQVTYDETREKLRPSQWLALGQPNDYQELATALQGLGYEITPANTHTVQRAAKKLAKDKPSVFGKLEDWFYVKIKGMEKTEARRLWADMQEVFRGMDITIETETALAKLVEQLNLSTLGENAQERLLILAQLTKYAVAYSAKDDEFLTKLGKAFDLYCRSRLEMADKVKSEKASEAASAAMHLLLGNGEDLGILVELLPYLDYELNSDALTLVLLDDKRRADLTKDCTILKSLAPKRIEAGRRNVAKKLNAHLKAVFAARITTQEAQVKLAAGKIAEAKEAFAEAIRLFKKDKKDETAEAAPAWLGYAITLWLEGKKKDEAIQHAEYAEHLVITELADPHATLTSMREQMPAEMQQALVEKTGRLKFADAHALGKKIETAAREVGIDPAPFGIADDKFDDGRGYDLYKIVDYGTVKRDNHADPAEALKYFTLAINVGPIGGQYLWALIERAKTYHQMGQKAEARVDVEAILVFDPESRTELTGWGEEYAVAPFDGAAEAMRLCATIPDLQTNPDERGKCETTVCGQKDSTEALESCLTENYGYAPTSE
ncbi:MAG: hypothetical protein ABIE84_00450 [bacterium]